MPFCWFYHEAIQFMTSLVLMLLSLLMDLAECGIRLCWFLTSVVVVHVLCHSMLAFASSKIIETLKTGTYLAISVLLIRSVFSFEPHHDKPCFCHMRTTKAQISLRIRAVWSAPLLFGAWIVYNGWMDELGFYVPSTVFQSFRDEDSI